MDKKFVNEVIVKTITNKNQLFDFIVHKSSEIFDRSLIWDFIQWNTSNVTY